MNRTFFKRDLVLKEDVERNYAASTDEVNSSPSELVNKTKQEHSDADSVTVTGDEIDGDTSTQTTTVEVNNTPSDLQKAQKMARTLKSQGINTNFKVNLNNSKNIEGDVIGECITFTKGELSKFLKNI
jgi:hypothetical protein